jgi:hypothetical protein
MVKRQYKVKDSNVELLNDYIKNVNIVFQDELLEEETGDGDDFYINYFPILPGTIIEAQQTCGVYGKDVPGIVGSHVMCSGCDKIGKVIKHTILSRFEMHDSCVSFKVSNCSSCQAKKVSKSNKKRMAADEDFEFLTKFRIAHATRLRMLLMSGEKKKSFYKLIGCDAETLIKHISSHFEPGMSANNYGKKGWAIDHLIPLSWARSREELFKLCHYTNLAPKWNADNIRKGNKYGEIITEQGIIRITREDYNNLIEEPSR